MIHPSAIIDPSCEIGLDVSIGPWTLIGPNVKIGSQTVIGAHCVIERDTQLGHHNTLSPFVSLGAAPQDAKYQNEMTELIIGNHNVLREYCSIHRGTASGLRTLIGDHNMFMAYSHVAHDCLVGHQCVFANNSQIAGHVLVEDYVTLSGLSGVHQNCRLGAHSFIGGGSIVLQDVAPYTLISGHPASLHGLNKIGLARRGFDADTLKRLKQAYKILFRSTELLETRLQRLSLLTDDPLIQHLIQFVRSSSRGIIT